MGAKLHNSYFVLPFIAAGAWFITLLVLLLTWICTGRPHYKSQEGDVAYISDVGASYVKPLFIVGAVITGVTFVLTLASERLLQHKARLLPAQRNVERILSYCAIGGALIGGVGLILLSILDTLRFTTAHRICLFVFMLGVTLSAIFTVVEYRLLAKSYASYNALRKSYMAKGVIAALLVALAVAFAALLFNDTQAGLDAGAILEWVIGFGFNLYLLTFWYDLRLAAPRHDINQELKDGGAAADVGQERFWWRV